MAAFAALWLCACGAKDNPSFVADHVDPSVARQATSTAAWIHGANFYNSASASLGKDDAVVVSRWSVSIGAPDRTTVSATRESAHSLAFEIPAGLPLGTHDVVVVSPKGERRVMTGALTIEEPGAADGGVDSASSGGAPSGGSGGVATGGAPSGGSGGVATGGASGGGSGGVATGGAPSGGSGGVATGGSGASCTNSPVPNNTTQCPAQCSSCDLNSRCRLECNSAGSCAAQTFNCPAGWECEVRCIGANACQGIVVNCPSTYRCELKCNQDNACQSATLNCADGPCSLRCQKHTCANATQNCSTGACGTVCSGTPSPTQTSCAAACQCDQCMQGPY